MQFVNSYGRSVPKPYREISCAYTAGHIQGGAIVVIIACAIGGEDALARGIKDGGKGQAELSPVGMPCQQK